MNVGGTYLCESNTLGNVVEQGQRGVRRLHVAGVAAVTRHGLASNARSEPDKTEENLRKRDTVFFTTTTSSAATASTLPVVPVRGGRRHICARFVGTFSHYRQCWVKTQSRK